MKRHIQDFGHQEHNTETTHMVTSLKKLPEGKQTTYTDTSQDKTQPKILFQHANLEDMQGITNPAVCHADDPGRQEGAASFPTGYQWYMADELV